MELSNFAADVVDAADPRRLALVELTHDGSRREWTFGDVQAGSAALALRLRSLGVERGEVVLTLIGNRPEWVMSVIACIRIGAVALPCSEQLRGHDIRARLDAASPAVVICDERNLGELAAARPSCEVLVVPDPSLFELGGRKAPPAVLLREDEPALITFTSGTSGPAKGIVHGHRYFLGQRLQAEHWLAPAAGDLVWCTAASGWSKSARNVFIAPWLRGAATLLHDERFDPLQRAEIVAREQVRVLCMAPTEYRIMAKRLELPRFPALRGLVAAGEALNPEVFQIWRAATGLDIRDGYGQTETGQLTAMPAGKPARAGSMGRALPGIALSVDGGELVLDDPSTDPTFFVRYLSGAAAPVDVPWRTGDRVQQDEDGYIYFEGRSDDVIISAGYRIGPFEVESALVSHPAVAEAAVVAAPDEERGSLVRAVVVLRPGYEPSTTLVGELQEHVKRHTAPYKYPRLVEFAAELPKTASGKVRRALLRNNP